jgi:hypothetical protein
MMTTGVTRGAAVAATAMLRRGALLVWMTVAIMVRLLLTMASGAKGERAGSGTEEWYLRVEDRGEENVR